MNQTTIVIDKSLRDNLMKIKYKYDISNLNQVIQFIYNIRDETKFKLNKKLGETQ